MLFKFFFPYRYNELQRYKNMCQELVDTKFELQEIIKNQKRKNMELEAANELINEVNNSDHQRFLKTEKDKEGKVLILTASYNAVSDQIPYYLNVYAYSEDHYKFINNATLMPDYYKQNHSVFIQDFQTKDIDKGRGSVALQCLLDICDQNKIKKISGKLSLADWDHIDRLEYFYSKAGFQVNIDPEDKSGSIKRTLPEN